ncbi:CTSO [Bugula neritina]|uniref:CTSO n=1 Tax=Bugula neritina TaxID=10212 RepID=A0A7J7JER5_BUGNE|nr:CTSO [Bugula neritina]
MRTFLLLIIFQFFEVIVGGDRKALFPSTPPTSHIYNLSKEEFIERYLSSYKPSAPNSQCQSTLSHLPQKWDWREKGYVSPVRNQKSCGGCWAFAVTETIESAAAKKFNASAPVLSVQQIIDCDPTNKGCKGGYTCTSLKWLTTSNKLVVPQSDYPLTDETEKCLSTNSSKSGVLVENFQCCQAFKNETNLLLLLYKYGPLVAGVDASTWNEYMGGIIQYHCGTSINHAVQIVGYDLTGDVPYYIIKNSWGDDWGHNGYVYLRIGGNTCGITQGINSVTDVRWLK